MNKKRFYLFFLIIFIILFLNAGFCSAAWKLNAGYPTLPFAPSLNENSRLPDYIKYLFFAGVYIAGALAVISMAIGGIQLISAAENPDRIGNAKDRIRNSIIGLVLLMASVIIMEKINPNLRQLTITVLIKEPSGLQLIGPGDIKTSAPDSVADMAQQYAGKYNGLRWPDKISDINGKTYDNCPDKNVAAYMVYVYKNVNFSGVINWGEITCGGDAVDLSGGQSYIAMKEVPGVYLYPSNDKCAPAANSDEKPIGPLVKSIPNLKYLPYNTNIRSYKIINGHDDNGPFFGMMLFNYQNYHGSLMIQQNAMGYHGIRADGGCDSVKSKMQEITGGLVSANLIDWTSFLIFKHERKGESAGAGIKLFSQRDASNGNQAVYCPKEHPTQCVISGNDINNISGGNIKGNEWVGDLSKMQVTPVVGEPIPLDESIACHYFSGDKNTFKKCFQSMEIDGKFLVLLSYYEPRNGKMGNCNWIRFLDCYEAFPQPGKTTGPTDINETDIKPEKAKWIEIIPLEEELFPSNSQ